MSAFTAVKVLASGPFAGRSSSGDKAAASAWIGSSSCRILRPFHPHQPFSSVSSSSPSILRPIQAVSSSDVLSSKIEPNSPLSNLMFGFVHLYNGQEAVSTGFIRLLKKEDSVVSTYRDHVHALSKGVPARAVMAELFGKATGCCRGQGGSMHMFSAEHNLLGGFAFIGEGIPVATGAAFTSRYRREVLKKPTAIMLPSRSSGTAPATMASSSRGYWKARRGEGPTLVECETYRFRGHSLADPDELRNPDEKARYAARDPIVALKKYVIEHNLATESDLKAIEKKIDEVIEEAVDQLLENVFADPRGFGIGPDGKYRCEDPGFTQGTAEV
ncbi:unnamed protein product [Spirodela intermedia]|uniref:Dehydrogenase E1 component domain-containing protein n=1 Tax=Spirodela intermedia TaxID=51605 RepID=A0A7I8J995_SPIIN|nr:unnamed protein product [Spirodela intermedia]CAA6666664.1 unnamed protein product [Spirodela intermedia]